MPDVRESLYALTQELREEINGSEKEYIKHYSQICTLFHYHGFLGRVISESNRWVAETEPPKGIKITPEQIMMADIISRATLRWSKPYELISQNDFKRPKKSWRATRIVKSSPTTISKTIKALMDKQFICRFRRTLSDSQDRYYYAINIGRVLACTFDMITEDDADLNNRLYRYESEKSYLKQLNRDLDKVMSNEFTWNLASFIRRHSDNPAPKSAFEIDTCYSFEERRLRRM